MHAEAVCIHHVVRGRLLARLTDALAGRLTLVVAPAGYGKTTLLDQWVRSLNLPWLVVRYLLGEADNEPLHLLTGLAAAGRAASPAFPPMPAAGDAQTPLSYALSQLFQQPAGAGGLPCLLILDDTHLLTSAAVYQALDTLLSMPAWPVHLVLASRSLPPLSTIARLRVEGRLVEMDEQELRFSPEEVRSLAQARGLELTEQELSLLNQRTEGWPVALQLACQATGREGAGSLAAVLRRMGNERHLFDYLAGQVLAWRPESLRTFMRRTALLPYLTADLCDGLLGAADSSAMLDRLERGHLFIGQIAGGPGRRYRYHALFQTFLRRCLDQEEGAEATRDWQTRAARCLLAGWPGRPAADEMEDQVAAVDLLLEAARWPEAAGVMESLAQRLDWGQLTLMEPWFGRLPPELVAARPDLLLALGMLRERQCRWSEARLVLAQATERFRERGALADVGRALHRQAWVHLRQGEYDAARACGAEAVRFLEGEPDCRPELAHSYRLLGGCLAETGDLQQGEVYLQKALCIFQQEGDRLGEGRVLSNLAGTIYLNQGRLSEAIETEEMSLRLLDQMGSYQVGFVLSRLGDAYRLRGQPDASRVVLERLLRLTDVHQDRFLRGYALYSLGHLHRESGNREAARACYQEARLLGEGLREPALLCEPRLGLALLHLDEGDLREARRQGQAALEQARVLGFPLFEGQGLLAAGQVWEMSGRTGRAEADYRQALEITERIGDHYDSAEAHLCLAHLCRQEGRDAEAVDHLGSALELSSRHGYDYLLVHRGRRRALPLLVAAVGATADSPDVREAVRLLGEIGQEAVEPLLSLLPPISESGVDAARVGARVVRLLGEIGDDRALPALNRLRGHPLLRRQVGEALERIAAAPRPPLRVLVLGGFQVLRGDLPVPPEAWQRRKTRLLLLYLLIHRRRQVPRDELLEALWPDLPPESAGLALNTTFSDLRRVLEPHLGKGLPSRYLVRDEETLGLNPAGELWYDVEAFERAVRGGEPNSRPALDLYRGDLLPEEPYLDWVLRERERVRSLYLNSLMAWLEERMHAGAWREAAEMAQRILDREPWLEEAWRALMQSCAMLGRRSEALQAYQACERALRQELDAAPSAETRALYDQLRA